jgi:dUTP pyrophosphatase
MSTEIKIKRFDKSFPLPEREENAGGIDLICRETITIPPNGIKAIRQNVAVKVPDGWVLLIFSRSSTPMRKGLMLANGVGVLDPFYCGENDELLAFMHNITDKPVTVEAGDRIVQGVFIKPEQTLWKEVDTMGEIGHDGYQHDPHLNL